MISPQCRRMTVQSVARLRMPPPSVPTRRSNRIAGTATTSDSDDQLAPSPFAPSPTTSSDLSCFKHYRRVSVAWRSDVWSIAEQNGITITHSHTHLFEDGKSVTKSCKMWFNNSDNPTLGRRKEMTFTHPWTGESYVHQFVMTKNSEDLLHTSSGSTLED